eukprot:213004-Amphidinium_carterae.1
MAWEVKSVSRVSLFLPRFAPWKLAEKMFARSAIGTSRHTWSNRNKVFRLIVAIAFAFEVIGPGGAQVHELMCPRGWAYFVTTS